MRGLGFFELIVIGAVILAVASLIGFAIWRVTTNQNRSGLPDPKRDL
jgi:hypothetical protein